jgi:serine phosphatase RsbU (regulator of sigma subunit)
MISLLHFLQRRLRPELNARPTAIRYMMMSPVVGILYSFPLVLFGLFWLAFRTNWNELMLHIPALILILIGTIIFSRLRFSMLHTLKNGHMVSSDGDFVGLILWASLLIYGPSILWIFLLWIIAESILEFTRSINRDTRWDLGRSACLNSAALLIPSLISLEIYQNLNGKIPIAGLTSQSIFSALPAVLSYALLFFLAWLPFVLYVIWVQKSKFSQENVSGLFWFTVGTMELPFVALPLGVLASGIYVEHGLVVFGIYLLSLILIALLANQLSHSAAKNRRQMIQLMGLEKLGRDILAAPTDARDLPRLLRTHIPAMFPCRSAGVWLTPETYLLKFPDGKDNYTPGIWLWLLTQNEPEVFPQDADLPWENTPKRHFALLTTPILDPLTGEPIGGLFIELQPLPQTWDKKTLREHLPVLQNLSAQIASALEQAKNLQDSLQHQRVSQELRLAGEIQSSFLPDHVPELPGWDIAASLIPARQTSGDFYDFFMLEGGRLGIVIADVADKGLGAALYMALGRTLLLTYAQEFPTDPGAVLRATNRRLLMDARAQMFITLFYGLLDPENGQLLYCNAGHFPGLLLNEHHKAQRLDPTGIALGIDLDAVWTAVEKSVEVGDILFLYTDGLVEASNPGGDLYGSQKLIERLRHVANRPSQWILRAIQDDVAAYEDGIPQSDDFTMICLRRRP